MTKLKIHDCSQSLGTYEGGIMSDLQKYAQMYEAVFVEDPAESDIIITNDIYPEKILALDKPRVKRVDQIFWQRDTEEENALSNEAVSQSDCVIFVSFYSKVSYTLLNSPAPNKTRTILNNADHAIFNRVARLQRKKNAVFTFVASAPDWTREEKRFDDLVDFAQNIQDNIYLVGHCDVPGKDLPPNIYQFGEVEQQINMADILNHAEAFVHFAFRDSAPSEVCQAINCGLPILYAASGGTGELVDKRGVGVGIEDDNGRASINSTPRLNIFDIMESYSSFKESFPDLSKQAQEVPHYLYYQTLSDYFDVFQTCSKEKTI